MPNHKQRRHPERSEGPLYFAVAIACSLPLIAGCHSQSSLSRKDCVGTYKAYAEDNPTGDVCFILRADGTYTAGDLKPGDGLNYLQLAAGGKWKLKSGAPGQRLFIDEITLPIGRKQNSISITVHDDPAYSCNLLK